ncbi:MAG: HAD family hydrolase [Thermotaleaceae bacterium]
MHKAVFLDRDGVINDNQYPVNRPEDLKLFPWTGEAIRLLNTAGFLIFVITNQGGIEMGYFSHKDLDEIHQSMMEILSQQNAQIHGIEYCPHFKTKCQCRKPEPGMILKASQIHGIDLNHSYMVGDREMDIDAGNKAGCTTIKIGAPYAPADYHAENLLIAAEIILTNTAANP